MQYLTNAQVVQLRDALTLAFDRPSMVAFTAIALDMDYGAEITPGAFKNEVSEVVKWTEQRGLTLRLLQGAEQARPNNKNLVPALNEFKSALIAETAATLAPAQTPAEFQYQLQRIVRPELPFADVAVWRQRLEQVERAVCRVELTQGTGVGSGFLVAKNLVMTCHHVINEVVGTSAGTIADVVLRFDYKRNPDDAPIVTPEYRLLPDWLAASSQKNELDYALLRVTGIPESRRWLKLSSDVLREGHPVQIVQHPKALPMKLAFGAVTPGAAANTLEYNTNTDEGSSGSPVSAADWKVVALHNAAGPTNNRGTTCAAILQDLATKQLSGLLA